MSNSIKITSFVLSSFLLASTASLAMDDDNNTNTVAPRTTFYDETAEFFHRTDVLMNPSRQKVLAAIRESIEDGTTGVAFQHERNDIGIWKAEIPLDIRLKIKDVLGLQEAGQCFDGNFVPGTAVPVGKVVEDNNGKPWSDEWEVTTVYRAFDTEYRFPREIGRHTVADIVLKGRFGGKGNHLIRVSPTQHCSFRIEEEVIREEEAARVAASVRAERVREVKAAEEEAIKAIKARVAAKAEAARVAAEAEAARVAVVQAELDKTWDPFKSMGNPPESPQKMRKLVVKGNSNRSSENRAVLTRISGTDYSNWRKAWIAASK